MLARYNRYPIMEYYEILLFLYNTPAKAPMTGIKYKKYLASNGLKLINKRVNNCDKNKIQNKLISTGEPNINKEPCTLIHLMVKSLSH
jgi:hypothetical protein